MSEENPSVEALESQISDGYLAMQAGGITRDPMAQVDHQLELYRRRDAALAQQAAAEAQAVEEPPPAAEPPASVLAFPEGTDPRVRDAFVAMAAMESMTAVEAQQAIATISAARWLGAAETQRVLSQQLGGDHAASLVLARAAAILPEIPVRLQRGIVERGGVAASPEIASLLAALHRRRNGR